MTLILASHSRARADLLRSAGYAFTQIPSNEDERPFEPGEDPEAYVRFLARQKAAAVAARHPDAVVLGADTVLYLEGAVIGKPADLEDAVRILTHQAGKTHRLITGICVVPANREGPWDVADTALVTMREWTPERIRRHVTIAQPLAYAGAYALQREGCAMIERLDGDPNTVIGLPMSHVESLLARAGIRP